MSRVAYKKPAIITPLEGLIRIVRGHKVILDHDLAKIYGVETRILNRAVNRNQERFPDDFMFKLSPVEMKAMISQFGTSSKRKLTNQQLAFTEQGIAMLSSVLRSPRAIEMNILIMRAFVRMRDLMATHKDLALRVEKLEREHEQSGAVIEILVEDIDNLSKEIHWIKNPPLKPKRRIGYVVANDEDGDD